ncbi:hypothetical protein B0T17DRAFT_525859 [Bombardia bombarda]|uniref:Uncharacterized protein n=1 Tax=Bombardia bombarda TaxID=252184 RepID=A0AA39X924_9PEZI|nr:hypothetical protein B0T17DRAFT_525859 [Bombardia bombarda]
MKCGLVSLCDSSLWLTFCFGTGCPGIWCADLSIRYLSSISVQTSGHDRRAVRMIINNVDGELAGRVRARID